MRVHRVSHPLDSRRPMLAILFELSLYAMLQLLKLVVAVPRSKGLLERRGPGLRFHVSSFSQTGRGFRRCVPRRGLSWAACFRVPRSRASCLFVGNMCIDWYLVCCVRGLCFGLCGFIAEPLVQTEISRGTVL